MARVLSAACDELENYFYEKLLCGHKTCSQPSLKFFLLFLAMNSFDGKKGRFHF